MVSEAASESKLICGNGAAHDDSIVKHNPDFDAT